MNEDIPSFPDNANSIEIIKEFEILENLVISKVNKFLGYWTSQMEDRKKKLKGPWASNKARRKKNIQALLSMISEHGGFSGIDDKESNRRLRLEAAAVLKVTDRSVLDYLQEIKGKKTRKKV